MKSRGDIAGGKYGFTITEILIAVTIIVLLIVIPLLMYSNSLESGRDTQRKNDIGTIQSALEKYKNDNGIYPETLDALVLEGYLASKPEDPRANESVPGTNGQLFRYDYDPSPNGASYSLRGYLEEGDDNSPPVQMEAGPGGNIRTIAVPTGSGGGGGLEAGEMQGDAPGLGPQSVSGTATVAGMISSGSFSGTFTAIIDGDAVNGTINGAVTNGADGFASGNCQYTGRIDSDDNFTGTISECMLSNAAGGGQIVDVEIEGEASGVAPGPIEGIGTVEGDIGPGGSGFNGDLSDTGPGGGSGIIDGEGSGGVNNGNAGDSRGQCPYSGTVNSDGTFEVSIALCTVRGIGIPNDNPDPGNPTNTPLVQVTLSPTPTLTPSVTPSPTPQYADLYIASVYRAVQWGYEVYYCNGGGSFGVNQTFTIGLNTAPAGNSTTIPGQTVPPSGVCRAAPLVEASDLGSSGADALILLATADLNNDIQESNETNNQRTETYTGLPSCNTTPYCYLNCTRLDNRCGYYISTANNCQFIQRADGEDITGNCDPAPAPDQPCLYSPPHGCAASQTCVSTYCQGPTPTPTPSNTPIPMPTNTPRPTVPLPPTTAPTLPACHGDICGDIGTACCTSTYVCTDDPVEQGNNCLPRVLSNGKNNCANCGYHNDYLSALGDAEAECAPDDGDARRVQCALGGGEINNDCYEIFCY